MFCNTGRHHSVGEYAHGEVPSNELQIYTWQDATLRELTTLVRDVNPDTRRKGTFFDFALVYMGGGGGGRQVNNNAYRCLDQPINRPCLSSRETVIKWRKSELHALDRREQMIRRLWVCASLWSVISWTLALRRPIGFHQTIAGRVIRMEVGDQDNTWEWMKPTVLLLNSPFYFLRPTHPRTNALHSFREIAVV